VQLPSDAVRDPLDALRHLADAVPALVWMAQPDGTVDFYSRQVDRYDGFAQDASGAWVWAPVLHEDDVEPTTAAWSRSVATGEPYEIEHRVRMADGTLRWHVSRATPVRDASGAVSRWYGTAVDIHDTKAAEQALKESEERYRALFDTMDQAYCIIEVLYDEDGRAVDYRFLEVNRAFQEQTGLADATDRTAREMVPDLEHYWVETYGRVAASRQQVRFVQHAESMGRWFDVSASPVGPQGSRRVALLFTDVTARKQAEAALRESEERYRALFKQAPAFIAVLRGPEHRFEFVNPAYTAVVGDRPLLGRRLREALPELEGQGLFEILDRVYSQGTPYSETDRPVLLQRSPEKEPETRYVDFVYQPLRDPEGAVIGVIALGVDTTDRIETRLELDRTNAELERANQELERRVDDRTQQVRSLTRALTIAEQRERQRIAYILHEDLQQLVYAAMLVSQSGDAERLQAVLQEAMNLTRTLSHDLSPPLLEHAELDGLLEWVAHQKRIKHGLEVDVKIVGSVSLPDSSLRILVYQVLRELLFNVVKHSGVKCARVTAEQGEGVVRICIEDDGTGFDLAAHAQGRPEGLGLRSARERLDLVGGRLMVESVEGRGTCVTIEVPAGGD
jgi:PAS domain S-box-containing protein